MRALVIGAITAIAVGCGNADETDELGQLAEPMALPEAPPPPEPPPPELDAEGRLLESGDTLVGVVLPRGLRIASQRGRHTRLLSSHPPSRLIAYFGTRIATGNIERVGEGARYREATRREGGGPSFDLAISAGAGGSSIVVIDELQPVPATPPPEAESLRRLEAALNGQSG